MIPAELENTECNTSRKSPYTGNKTKIEVKT